MCRRVWEDVMWKGVVWEDVVWEEVKGIVSIPANNNSQTHNQMKT